MIHIQKQQNAFNVLNFTTLIMTNAFNVLKLSQNATNMMTIMIFAFHALPVSFYQQINFPVSLLSLIAKNMIIIVTLMKQNAQNVITITSYKIINAILVIF